MTIIEAYEAMKGGERVRRSSWPIQHTVAMAHDGTAQSYIVGERFFSFNPSVDDVLSTDWEIV